MIVRCWSTSIRFWAHISMAYVFTMRTWYILYKEYDIVPTMRLRFLASGRRRPDQYTMTSDNNKIPTLLNARSKKRRSTNTWSQKRMVKPPADSAHSTHNQMSLSRVPTSQCGHMEALTSFTQTPDLGNLGSRNPESHENDDIHSETDSTADEDSEASTGKHVPVHKIISEVNRKRDTTGKLTDQVVDFATQAALVVYNANTLADLVEKKKNFQNWLTYYYTKYERNPKTKPTTKIINVYDQKYESGASFWPDVHRFARRRSYDRH